MIPQTFPKGTVAEDWDSLQAAFQRVLESGRYILGEEVVAFEDAFADFIGVDHAIGVANGTQAVELALRALGIEAGDGVATVSHTAVATVNAIRATGAIPVFVDIDPVSYLMDPGELRRVVEHSRSVLKAVLVVHLYGNPCPLDPLIDLCHEHRLKLVEDCAQAHGAKWNGQRVGSFGDAAAFSFYPTKNLGAIGDGGMIVTSNVKVAETARLLREYGWRERYVSAVEGTNSRLDPLQAAFLRIFLNRLDERNQRRRALATLYDNLLSGSGIQTPVASTGGHHVYHQYVIAVAERDALAADLAKAGIGTAIHYPVPVHHQQAYARFAAKPLPVTDAVVSRILSLPMYPQLSPLQVQEIVRTIRAFTPFRKPGLNA